MRRRRGSGGFCRDGNSGNGNVPEDGAFMGNIINLDITFFFQLANFLITLVVLNILLIRPVRRQIAERTDLTAGYLAEIERFNREAEAKLAACESAQAEARARAVAAREQLKAEGRAREQEILGAAQEEARGFLRASKEDVARQSKAALQSLRGRVEAFAAGAAARILG
jgi:F-type H+-transporting ATPase subunit b